MRIIIQHQHRIWWARKSHQQANRLLLKCNHLAENFSTYGGSSCDEKEYVKYKYIPPPSWSLDDLELVGGDEISQLSSKEVARLARFAHLRVGAEEEAGLRRDVGVALRCARTLRKLKAEFEESLVESNTAQEDGIVASQKNLAEEECACDAAHTDLLCHDNWANNTSYFTPLREDVVCEGGDAQVVLSNARETLGSFFLVPKVVLSNPEIRDAAEEAASLSKK